MRTRSASRIVDVLAGGLLLLAALLQSFLAGHALAGPTHTLTFTQSGFSGGATISGSFSGTDSDGDGWLNSFQGEIASYSMAFSGNMIVQAFSHSQTDFATAGPGGGLVYRLGMPRLLGDDITSPFEGIGSGPLGGGATPPPPITPFAYRTGYGPTGFLPQPWGFVEDNTAIGLQNPMGNIDVTFQYVVITSATSVPEPGGLGLVALGALAAWLGCRKR
jgi:hypothetical protein